MNRGPDPRAGVTLLEMMIVVTIIGLMVGILFPTVSAGVETLRLNEATNQIVSFLNDALNRAERREQAVEIAISRRDHTLTMESTQSGFQKKIELPQSISIVRVLPDSDEPADGPRRIMIYPGGAVPRVGVEIANERKSHRIVRVDPITGVPRVEKVETP